MDDDELPSPGLSGWAGIALGRMWANHERSVDETMDWLAKRRQPQINVNGLINQNRALAAENARLRQDLADYKLNYSNLKAWANRAEARINQLLKDRG
jgi:hypothetical protein